ncbi:hypothetical protein Bca52824_012521 [Brassica carinata]|uniref:Uncharacterized protein n=1 Tax=Brassica carinata TaxID=52824 RepID=A0A8X7VW89_BRACI|nr:hypothetical protein Bca52824_012521 [Brassica carinata]
MIGPVAVMKSTAAGGLKHALKNPTGSKSSGSSWRMMMSNEGEDPYASIQTGQDDLFQDFGLSSGVNLQPQQGQVCNNNIGAQFDSFSGYLPQVCSFTGGNNGLPSFGGVVYSSSIRSSQLDLGPHQVCSFIGRNNNLVPCGDKEQVQVCCVVVEINSSSSVGGVKEELEEECSRKR